MCHSMRMQLTGAGPCAIVIAALALAPRAALAQHDHHGGHHHGGGDDARGGEPPHGEPAEAPRSSFGASIGVLAAGYDTMLFSGDYEGLAVTGWPVTTLSRGEIVWDGGQVLAQPGRGQFLPCATPQTARA